MARKKIKPAYSDPQNSIDLFDADRLNSEKDGLFCVASAILLNEVSDYRNYVLCDRALAGRKCYPEQSIRL